MDRDEKQKRLRENEAGKMRAWGLRRVGGRTLAQSEEIR